MVVLRSAILLILLVGCNPSSNTGSGGYTPITFESTRAAQAFRLLSESDNAFVDTYIDHVRSGTPVGVVHNGHTGTIYFTAAQFNQSLPMLASLIYHEAVHVELNHQGCDVTQESLAIKRQLRVLAYTGGAAWEIRAMQNQIGVHCG